jgi:hypothetical protein
MKYKMHIDIRITEGEHGYPGVGLTQDEFIELKNLGDAGELLLRIHQLIQTVESKSAR